MRNTIQHPNLGCWCEKLGLPSNEELPGTFVINGSSKHPGLGFMEDGASIMFVHNAEDGVENIHLKMEESQLEKNLKAVNFLNQEFTNRYDLKKVKAYDDMYDDAVKLMKSQELNAFDLSLEDKSVMQEYTRHHHFGKSLLLARRLVERGVGFIEVGHGGWDTHTQNHLRIEELTYEVDAALTALIRDLKRKNMLENTLVVIATEFGRTPQINIRSGRGHHPAAFSVAMAGGGMKGGYVYGKTDDRGQSVIENPVTIPDLHTTIGHALGLDYKKRIYSPSGRPFNLGHRGKAITELFRT